MLRSLPIAVPQNLTLVDPAKAVTVFVGPDMPPTVAPDACAANHQHLPVTDEQERALQTQKRLRAIRAAGADVAAMLKPPLYRSVDEQGSRTLYFRTPAHPRTKISQSAAYAAAPQRPVGAAHQARCGVVPYGVVLVTRAPRASPGGSRITGPAEYHGSVEHLSG
ncbi:hypothetical protein NMG29_34560 [Streptomyces cocklensis]|uniref:Uncharacterized protein n=1 Tax=Actinacidiphila cocklensis TaxID=887465 RepID=A0A9W4DTH1_9ACTN|nr:hypothetical protein [Actinacidiphila cocklensis]MDD1063236.1 hypothetical protein [Actinacidiphila cocklensis]CAG6393672.1 hypothetical protein SCOCK_210112 [Actinacidiphila cocklensis]